MFYFLKNLSKYQISDKWNPIISFKKKLPLYAIIKKWNQSVKKRESLAIKPHPPPPYKLTRYIKWLFGWLTTGLLRLFFFQQKESLFIIKLWINLPCDALDRFCFTYQVFWHISWISIVFLCTCLSIPYSGCLL